MALKALPLEPVEAHRLDDPRRPATAPVVAATGPAPQVPGLTEAPDVPNTPNMPPRERRERASPHELPPTANTAAGDDQSVITAPAGSVNPYAHVGRPRQVAVSLYVPQWERIEEQCAQLRAEGVRDATVTRWLFAVLHFRAPVEPHETLSLFRRWARIEADEAQDYFMLSREARGIRFFEPLWTRQRAVVTDLRHRAGSPRATLAMWTTAVVELCGPTCADEARALLRDLRQLLAGDPG